jgi:hypothetical protein
VHANKRGNPLELGTVIRATYSEAFRRDNPGEASEFVGKVVKNDGRECHVDFGADGAFKFHVAGHALRDVDGYDVAVQSLEWQPLVPLEAGRTPAAGVGVPATPAAAGSGATGAASAAAAAVAPPMSAAAAVPEPDPEVELRCWIFHDNPTHAARDIGMLVLVEGKAVDGTYVILRGAVQRSGRVSSFGFGAESKGGASGRAHRGEYCLLVGEIKGFLYEGPGDDVRAASGDGARPIEERINPKNGDTDVRLRDASASSARRIVEALCSVPGTVSVILDPQRQNGTQGWYPRKKDMRGNGKIVTIPASFRSNNVGYMRLGDDMNEHGNQFLSLDAGKTFLNDGNAAVLKGIGLRVRCE